VNPFLSIKKCAGNYAICIRYLFYLYRMLTAEEKKFMEYWESQRDKPTSFWSKMLFGGPWGLIFAMPILIVVMFHDWYKRMIPITEGQMIIIFICVIGTAVFYAYFHQQMRWEKNEQLYKELKFKEKNSVQSD